MRDSQLYPILGRRDEINVPKYLTVVETDLGSAYPLQRRKGGGGGRITSYIQSLNMLDDDGPNVESKCPEIFGRIRDGMRQCLPITGA